jgi:ribosome-binding protein aMBF1 (putative translation factor)
MENDNMSITIKNHTFTTFDDLWSASNLTQLEKDEIQLKIALVGKLIEAREQKGISQKQLAEMSGMKQPSIARLESMKTTPQIDTLLKVLRPLGYTLAIVPSNEG